MTETSPVSAMTTTDGPISKRVNTVGRLLPHVEYIPATLLHHPGYPLLLTLTEPK